MASINYELTASDMLMFLQKHYKSKLEVYAKGFYAHQEPLIINNPNHPDPPPNFMCVPRFELGEYMVERIGIDKWKVMKI